MWRKLVLLALCVCVVRGVSTDFEDHSTTILELSEGEIEVEGETFAPRLRVSSPGGQQYRVINGQQVVFVSKDDPAYRITLVNKLDEPTSMHPHGLTGPMDTDGVAYITQTPIYPGRVQKYDFPLAARDMGTYFLHSHFGLQHVEGLSIPLIVEGLVPTDYPNAARISTALDAVMFLEDFCLHALGANPGELGDNPHCNNSMQVVQKMEQIWNSMAANFPMTTCQGPIYDDDIAARYHLVNERTLGNDPSVIRAEPGQAVRLRVVCSTSFAFYRLDFGSELSATVITADGKWVQPRDLRQPSLDPDTAPNTLWIAPAQRYDILIDAPMTPGVYLIRAVVQVALHATNKQQTGMLLVVGASTPIPPPGTYSNTHSDPDYVFMERDPDLHAWFPLPPRPVDRELHFNVTGDNGYRGINGYSWLRPPMIPEPYVPNPFPLLVEAGERVCVNINNFNPWAHPMHLHGHAFQVTSIVNGSLGTLPPSNGPLRDTVQTTKGCGTTRICFDALNPGTWLIHCHKDLHAVAGMATSVEYLTGGDGAGLGVAYDPIDAAFPDWGKRKTVVVGGEVNASSIVVGRDMWANQLELAAKNSGLVYGEDGEEVTTDGTTPATDMTTRSALMFAVMIAATVSFCVGVCLAIAVSRHAQSSSSSSSSSSNYAHHKIADSDMSESSSAGNAFASAETARDAANLKKLLIGVAVLVVLAALIVVIVVAGQGVTATVTSAASAASSSPSLSFLEGGGQGVASAKAWVGYSSADRLDMLLNVTRSLVVANALQTMAVKEGMTDTELVIAIQRAVSALSAPSLLQAFSSAATSTGWTTSPSNADLSTYQQRFGFPFLLRAGDAAAKLTSRLGHSVSTELSAASRELSAIVSSSLIARLASPGSSSPLSSSTTPAVLITTHMLDTTRGIAAQGVKLLLQVQVDAGQAEGMQWGTVAAATTNADGRANFAHADPAVAPGVYRVVFGVHEYFQAFGVDSIYPEVTVPFIVLDGNSHYHIPISASPFAFQTYRGT